MENNTDKEKQIYESWEKQGLFKADPNSDKEPYSLLMPPPNLTGDLHLGHAMQHSIMDALARYKRMQGFDVLLLPGVDHAGIQFEGTLTKILEKEGLSKRKLGREKFLERAWKFKEEVYESFHNTWTVMGISADWSREVFTFEPRIQKAVFEEFQTFWDQDLLYKGAYIVQWCPKCGTAIEDIEMEYEEKKETLYFIKYRIQGREDEFITIATARPETIFADTGIAIHPDHPKYGKYDGLEAHNPLTEELIPIFKDKRVDKDFGSGALKITPGHDPLDYEIGKDHNLPIVRIVDKSGRIIEDEFTLPDLAGLKVQEAREKVIATLKENGSLEKAEEYTHSVPACERCKTTVEPLISEEWFLKMEPLAKKALQNIDKITFYPENFKKILTDWLEKIHDWCISRSQWWGHRIPVWYCSKCNPGHQVGKDKDMVVSFEEPEKDCQTCGEKHWEQDDQVFDTWFSSGMWPITTLGWPQKTSESKKYFPWDFELTSPEIKYLWIARMIMLSLWFVDDIPFKNMFFHGMLRPLQGAKFSKSLGNAVYPNELRDSWGTDAVRMTLYTYSAPGRDSRTSKQLMDERAKNFRNFGNKLKNISKFVIELKPEDSATEISNHEDDKWIVEELNKTIQAATRNLDRYELHLATEEVYNFTWHTFADIYIEKSKARRADAQPTLEYVLDATLRLLHPFMPFLTEELWQSWGKPESIMKSSWPQSND